MGDGATLNAAMEKSCQGGLPFLYLDTAFFRRMRGRGAWRRRASCRVGSRNPRVSSDSLATPVDTPMLRSLTRLRPAAPYRICWPAMALTKSRATAWAVG